VDATTLSLGKPSFVIWLELRILGVAGCIRSHITSSMAQATTAITPARIHHRERVFEFVTGSEEAILFSYEFLSEFIRDSE
jgi:hypothetical protein